MNQIDFNALRITAYEVGQRDGVACRAERRTYLTDDTPPIVRLAYSAGYRKGQAEYNRLMQRRRIREAASRRKRKGFRF